MKHWVQIGDSKAYVDSKSIQVERGLIAVTVWDTEKDIVISTVIKCEESTSLIKYDGAIVETKIAPNSIMDEVRIAYCVRTP